MEDIAEPEQSSKKLGKLQKLLIDLTIEAKNVIQ